jgi:phospholipid/cholesterol/gamma-HCH transport system substrate-binding protein
MSAAVRQLRNHQRSLRVGVVSIVALLGLLVFAVTAQNGLPDYVPGVQRTSMDATFANVGALTAGNDVRIADVRVGYVKSIALHNGIPVVSMSLDGSPKVYGNASAIIRAQSGLGQKYIDINPGTASAGSLPSGGIPESRTQSATDLNDVLNALDPQTRADTQSLLRAVGGGLDGRGQQLSAGLSALPTDLSAISSISKALSQNQGADLATVLRAANDLSGHLQGQQAALARLVRGTGITLGALGTAKGQPLTTLLNNAPTGLTSLHSALSSLNQPLQDLGAAGVALQPGAAKLAAATPDLRGFLRESIPVLGQVKGFANQAVPAIQSLTPAITRIQPLVTQLALAFLNAQGPLASLAAYRNDVMTFFVRASSALGSGDSAGNWLRLYALPSSGVLSGNLPGVRDPLIHRQAYPAPGTVDSHNKNH